jgi:hypothetical protein
MRRLVGQLSVAQVDLKGGGNLGCVFDGMAGRDQSCGRAVRSLIPRAESGNCGVQVLVNLRPQRRRITENLNDLVEIAGK